MAVSYEKARMFIYQNGSHWERALFRHLFEGGPINHLYECLACYKNEDGGWGNGIEYDIKCPDSHPLALEFLLSVFRDTNLPVGTLLDGTVEWLEQNRKGDGSLQNPSTLHDYPYAPWWANGGQTAPDSITGNLLKHGLCSDTLKKSTEKWVAEHVSIEKIKENKWLFMAYHGYDYFTNVEQTPENIPYKQAVIENIIDCAKQVDPKQYFSIFHFAPTPKSEVAKEMPTELLDRMINHIEQSQREDGGWDDEHGLSYWQPYFSIIILLGLKNYGRLRSFKS